MMKNKRIKPTHTMVLVAAILLTVFSIVGSVTAAGLLPLTGNEISEAANTANKKVEVPRGQHSKALPINRNVKKVEFSQDAFKSVVKPKLWSCYNCGVVVAIESINMRSDEMVSTDNQELLSYLEAHRQNARIIALDDLKENQSNTMHQSHGDITYLIKVRMQDGTQHVITQDEPPQHEVGDKVRLTVGKMITA
ncbi:MAG: hypothetical protein U1E13_02055 [Methylophilaceae bacterium]|nr:hypothetical protein [Methylophilaceae bacterium]